MKKKTPKRTVVRGTTTRLAAASAPKIQDGEYSDVSARQEFRKRLAQYLADRGMNQSDLSRAIGCGRDAISCYMRGASLPTPRNLLKIATALKVQPGDLYPGVLTARVTDTARPVLEMKLDDDDPTQAWLRVNQKMSLAQASECLTNLMSILGDTSKTTK